MVFKNKMYLFGGSSRECENAEMFTLDLKLFKWAIVKVKADKDEPINLPKTRDEHSCVMNGNSMIVFGGFTFGQRSNEIFEFNFVTNTWRLVAHASKETPLPRAGHSAVIM